MTYKPSLRRRVSWLVLGLLVLAAILALLWVYPSKGGFDAEQWRAVVRADDHRRLEMADSLISNRRLYGLRHGEVLALLGPDCGCSYFKEWDLVYWLGPERNWISIDSEWLVIRFDQGGNVSDYRLVTD